jgi:hypothetical protein
MKKICILLAAVLLLCLGASAWAEDGVNVEIIKVDGVSVVVLTPEKEADFVLPAFLTLIEESAFEGIAAESVEVTGNVAAIETRAFADCKSLREITIPATVLKIDDHAFDGCKGVTVYGRSGTEAERIANLYGFTFVDPNAEPETPATPVTPEQPPVVLPFLPAD